MRKLAYEYLYLLIPAGVVIALDQWTKSLLRSRMAMGDRWPEDGWWLGLFQIVRTENSGAAFSMGSGFGWLFMLFAIAASLFMLIYYPRLPQHEPLLRGAVALLLGGTVGNLTDRITIGQVTDFFAIRFFAVINVADAAITLGVAGVILWTLLKEHQERKQAGQTE